jgi:ketosteroid isomerase-like protein
MIKQMGPRIKSLLLALCLSLPGASAVAQQTNQANATTVPPAFREMQQVEDRWATAVTKRDQYALELVLAPQYIGISASGDVTTRNQQIAHLFVKNAGPDSLEQKVISVRFVGDVAIVNGTYVMSWKGEKGPVLEKGIFSHVFEHVRDNWLCLNSQRTVVAEEKKGEASKEKPKRSNSELPLIYKGPESTLTKPAPGTNQPPQ